MMKIIKKLLGIIFLVMSIFIALLEYMDFLIWI